MRGAQHDDHAPAARAHLRCRTEREVDLRRCVEQRSVVTDVRDHGGDLPRLLRLAILKNHLPSDGRSVWKQGPRGGRADRDQVASARFVRLGRQLALQHRQRDGPKIAGQVALDAHARGLAVDEKTRERSAAAEWNVVDGARGRDAGDPPQRLEQLQVVLRVDGGIFAERRDPHRDDRARFEAEIDRQHARKAADHQARAGDEDDGQGDFRGDEQLTAAPGERRSLTSTAAGERRADVRARQPECRRESEHETGQERQRRARRRGLGR